jgi:murein DD-endopeptidase MepM/ murein hydrolase activator NlpD
MAGWKRLSWKAGMGWASRAWTCAMAIIVMAGCAHDGPVILRRFQLSSPPPVGDRSHYAVDIAADVGDQVLAAADGVVSGVSFQPGAGFTVVLVHPHLDRATLYKTLRSVAVQRGATVRRGQSLGEVGYPPEAGYQVHVHWAMFAGRHQIDPLAAGVDCVTNVPRDNRARLVYPVRC